MGVLGRWLDLMILEVFSNLWFCDREPGTGAACWVGQPLLLMSLLPQDAPRQDEEEEAETEDRCGGSKRRKGHRLNGWGHRSDGE